MSQVNSRAQHLYNTLTVTVLDGLKLIISLERKTSIFGHGEVTGEVLHLGSPLTSLSLQILLDALAFY